jgi:hypothetical protein
MLDLAYQQSPLVKAVEQMNGLDDPIYVTVIHFESLSADK